MKLSSNHIWAPEIQQRQRHQYPTMDLMSPAPIPLCDPAISPDFLTTITTFRIIVLTYNRPESLYRLLTSIKVYNMTQYQ